MAQDETAGTEKPSEQPLAALGLALRFFFLHDTKSAGGSMQPASKENTRLGTDSVAENSCSLAVLSQPLQVQRPLATSRAVEALSHSIDVLLCWTCSICALPNLIGLIDASIASQTDTRQTRTKDLIGQLKEATMHFELNN